MLPATVEVKRRRQLLIALGHVSSEEELDISGSPGHYPLDKELGVRKKGPTKRPDKISSNAYRWSLITKNAYRW